MKLRIDMSAFLLIFTIAASSFFFLPLYSSAVFDYAEHQTVEFVIADDGIPVEEVYQEYGDHKPSSLDHYLTLLFEDFKILPTTWLLVAIGVVFFAMITWLLVAEVGSLDQDHFVFYRALPIYGLFVLIGFGVHIYHWLAFDTVNDLGSVIHDTDVADLVAIRYYKWLFGGVITVVVYAFVNIVFLVVFAMLSEAFHDILRRRAVCRSERIRSDIGLVDPMVFVDGDGSCGVLDVSSGSSNSLIPRSRLIRRGTDTISLDMLFNQLLGQSKSDFVQAVGDDVISEMRQECADIGLTGAIKVTDLLKQRIKKVSQAVKDRITSRKLSCDDAGLFEVADRLVHRVTDAKVRLLQQHIAVNVEDGIDDAVSAFRASVLRRLRDKFPPLQKTDTSGRRFALPAGTKFYYESGNTEVYVIEQGPQVRSISVSELFLRNEFNSLKKRDRPKNWSDSRMFQLAFPYVIFVVRCYDGHPSSLYVFQRTQPLKDSSQELLACAFSNVDSSHQVCTGRWHDSYHDQTTTQKVEQIITHFWNSEFNTDHKGVHYDGIKHLDQRLKSIWHWSDASKADSLFVMNDVEWHESRFTIQSCVDSILSYALDDVQARYDKVVRQIMQEEFDVLSDEIGRMIRSMDVAKCYDDDTCNQLKDHIGGLLVQYEDVIGDVIESDGWNSDLVHAQLQQVVLQLVEQSLFKHFKSAVSKTPLRRGGDVQEILSSYSH